MIEPETNIIAFKPRTNVAHHPKSLMERIYAAGSLSIRADDRATKMAATMLQALGFLVIEEILDQAARRLSLPPDVIRERNFYRPGDSTHYGQTVKDADRIQTIWRQLKTSSEFDRRRSEIERFNESHVHQKRGLAAKDTVQPALVRVLSARGGRDSRVCRACPRKHAGEGGPHVARRSEPLCLCLSPQAR